MLSFMGMDGEAQPWILAAVNHLDYFPGKLWSRSSQHWEGEGPGKARQRQEASG